MNFGWQVQAGHGPRAARSVLSEACDLLRITDMAKTGPLSSKMHCAWAAHVPPRYIPPGERSCALGAHGVPCASVSEDRLFSGGSWRKGHSLPARRSREVVVA